MWTDILTAREARFTQRAVDRLANVPWAHPLLRKVEANGGLERADRPLLFEVRFAFELHSAGFTADYEYPAGTGRSTVDFRPHGPVEWLIELVSIETSYAVREATTTIETTGKQGNPAARVTVESYVLSTDAPDARQTEEGEIIRAMEKIEGKVFADGEVIKFPVPGRAMHVILTDMRGYLGGGADQDDYREVAYGHTAVPPEAVHRWNGKPVLGLFEPENPRPAACLIRERIHFLGFVCESNYREGEIREVAYYCQNRHLFGSDADGRNAFLSYPLQP